MDVINDDDSEDPDQDSNYTTKSSCDDQKKSEKSLSVLSSGIQSNEEKNELFTENEKSAVSKAFYRKSIEQPYDWRNVLKTLKSHRNYQIILFTMVPKFEIEKLLAKEHQTQNFIEKMYSNIEIHNKKMLDYKQLSKDKSNNPYIVFDGTVTFDTNKLKSQKLMKVAVAVDYDDEKNRITFSFLSFKKEALLVEETSIFELSHTFCFENEKNGFFKDWPGKFNFENQEFNFVENLKLLEENDLVWKKFQKGLKLKKKSKGVIDKKPQAKEELLEIIRCCWVEFFRCLAEIYRFVGKND